MRVSSKRVATIVLLLGVVAGIVGGGIWFANQRTSTSTATAQDATAKADKSSAQPVRVTTVRRQPIQAWVFAEGTARSVRREYLTFDRAGRVTFVKRSIDGGDLRAGESVRAGEVLARLDQRSHKSEMDSAQAAVAEAKAQLAVARTDILQAETQYDLAAAKFQRTEQLFRERATSKAEHEEVEANLKNAAAAKTAAMVKVQALEASLRAAEAKWRQASLVLEETEIASPIDGVIAYLNVEEGFYFTQSNIRTTSESEALQTIPIVVIDPSLYEITVDVPAYESDLLSVGQQVLLVPGGLSATAAFESDRSETPTSSRHSPHNWQAKGTVFSINPAVNPGGRSVQIKIRTTQGAERLKDGMFVVCWIEVRNKPEAIVAPFEAFLFEENQPYVFVVDQASDSSGERGVARRVDVRIGIESVAAREIAGGVQAGELLVTDGRYRLVDKAPVRIVDGGGTDGGVDRGEMAPTSEITGMTRRAEPSPPPKR